MSMGKAIAMVAVMSLVTIMIRFAPFVVFRKGKVPRVLEELKELLPCAVMGMLVVYCLKGVSFVSLHSFLPELAASLATAGLYLWRKNTLLSIIGGTVIYMLIVQLWV